ncbi:hypothetical protein MKX01_029148 [Papaver californicum]|nr:hypothetical protein MKX01_029148 [Papaver californicum]
MVLLTMLQSEILSTTKLDWLSMMEHELRISPESHEVLQKTCAKRRRTSDPKKILK